MDYESMRDAIRRRDWVKTYPTREAALAIIGWLAGDDWSSPSALDKRLPSVGIEWTDSFSVAAERCYEVYGYPELESGNVARRIAEAFMRPRKESSSAPRGGVAEGSDGLPRSSTPTAPSARPEGPQMMSYGFTPRR